MFDYLLYSHPPHHAPTKWQVFCQNVYNMDWCVVVYLLKKASQQFLVKLFSSMSCPYKMSRSLSKPYKMGCCSYFLASHASKGLASRLRRIYLRGIYTFSVPPSCPCKVRGPRGNSYNMVWCFVTVISCAYCHIAEDTPREVLKRKFEFKVILNICVVFLFPRPPSCHIMPLQNDRFPSKHLQDGLALWFSFFLKHAT